MSASELAEKSLEYMIYFTPYLIVMLSIAFGYKLIDLAYYALGKYRNRM